MPDQQGPVCCPGCGKPLVDEERPLFRYRDQLWCGTHCMAVAGDLRAPYRLAPPDPFNVRQVYAALDPFEL